MVNKIIFKKIKFSNINSKKFDKFIVKKGLFVFPSGPALATIEKSHQYFEVDCLIIFDRFFEHFGTIC